MGLRIAGLDVEKEINDKRHCKPPALRSPLRYSSYTNNDFALEDKHNDFTTKQKAIKNASIDLSLHDYSKVAYLLHR